MQVLLAVAPHPRPEARLKLAQLLLKKFNVPAVCLANQAVLSLFACGRTTGLCVSPASASPGLFASLAMPPSCVFRI